MSALAHRTISVAALPAVLMSLGCASAGIPKLLGPPREQPAALVGRWRAAPATAGDSAGNSASDLLVLAADARQWVEATARDTSTARAPHVRSTAWWWVYHADRTHPARLCLHWRPGRHAADCASFQLDSVALSGGWRRRLTWGTERYLASEP